MRWLCLVLLTACGVDVVELSAQRDVIVLGDVPPDAIERLGRDDGRPDPKQLGLSAPADGVAVPANIAPISFSVGAEPKDVVAFELRLRSARRELRVYTPEPTVVVPAEPWRQLLAEGDLHCEVRSLDTKDKVRASEARTLHVIAPLEDGQLALHTADGVERARISDSASSAAEPSFDAPLLRDVSDHVELEGASLMAPAGVWIADATRGSGVIAVTYWPASLGLAQAPDATLGGSGIARLRLDGTFEVLIEAGPGSYRRPRYSPDGAWLLFEGSAGKDSSLYIAPASGGAARSLCGGPAMMPMPMMGMMPPMATRGGAPAWLSAELVAFIADAHVWLTQVSLEPARCSPPVSLPAQDPTHAYQAVAFVAP